MQVADARGRQEADEYLGEAQGDDAAVGGLAGDGAGWHSHSWLEPFHGLTDSLAGGLLRLLCRLLGLLRRL